MRILWLSHLLPYPPKGGVQQRSYNLLREVSRYHEIHFLAFNQRALVPSENVSASVAALSEHCRVLDVIPIPSDYSPHSRAILAAQSLMTRAPYTVKWLHSKRFATAVRDAVTATAYDVAHFDTISLAQYKSLLPDIPASLTHHNIESAMLLRRVSIEPNVVRRAYFWQEARRLERYESRIAQSFAIHLTCSTLDAARLKAISRGARTAVVPNGVDTRYFDPAPFARQQVPKSVVFAGGLTWYPNVSAVQFLVREIWPRLKRKYPNAQATIIGRQPPDWLSTAATMDRSIHVTGFVDDVRPYMAEAQVYVCPIFDGGGTKLKVLDALAMGVPLVAHPISCEGIDVMAERNVLLATTPDEFVEQIGRLFDDQGLRERLSRSGRDLAVRQYDFDSIGRDLASLYEELGCT